MNNNESKTEPKKVFLLDLGSALTKIGFSSNIYPSIICSTSYGIPRIHEKEKILESNQKIFGEDLDNFPNAINRTNLFTYSQPNDFDTIYEFVQHLFFRMSIPTKNEGLILAYSHEWSNYFLYQLQAFLFQKFNFSSILPIRTDFLSLISHKVKTGVVLDIGHDYSRVIQFDKGKPLTTAGFKSNVAGKLIQDYLIKLYNKSHPYLQSPIFEPLISKIITEKCSLTIDIDKTLSDQSLDDQISEEIEISQFKEIMKLGIEKYLAPEVLFHPKLANSKNKSVDSLIIQSLKECHPSLRKNIYSNIILSGGGCAFTNFKERLQLIFLKIPMLANSNILIHFDPRLTVWKGMLVAANSSYYENKSQTQNQFFAKL
jgi:actin beta/gamma 1